MREQQSKALHRKGGIARSNVVGRTALLVVCAISLGACTTSGAMRGVGAQQKSDPTTEIALEPTTIEPSPSALAAIEQTAPSGLAPGETATISDPKLNEGVALNISDEGQTTPLALVQEEIPPAPEMATDRNEAILQIRQKGTNVSKIPTNVFTQRRSTVPKLTAAQQSEKTAEMQAAVQRNEGLLSADEAKRRSSAVKSMSQRANSHYRDALNKIEN